MAIPSATCTASYAGNNSTSVAYVVPFLFFKREHLKVFVTSAAGVETPLILTTDFTVTGEGDEDGGTLKTNAPWNSSNTITITRVPPETQPFVYSEGQRLPMKTLERSFDWILMVAQGAIQTLRRSLEAVKGRLDNLTLPWGSITDKPSTYPPSAHTHSFDSITDKPSTYPPVIGEGAGDAVAGNDPRLSDARTPSAHTHASADISDATANGHHNRGKVIKTDGDGLVRLTHLSLGSAVAAPGEGSPAPETGMLFLNNLGDALHGTVIVAQANTYTGEGALPFVLQTPQGTGVLALTTSADGSVSYNNLTDKPGITTTGEADKIPKIDAGGWLRVPLLNVQYGDHRILEADSDFVYVRNNAGRLVLTTEESFLADYEGKMSILWDGRALYDEDQNFVMGWSTDQSLADLYNQRSVSVNLRRLFNSAGDLVLDWQEKTLFHSDGPSLSWEVDLVKVHDDLIVDGACSISENLTIPNATLATAGHAVTRATGDARYGREMVAWKQADTTRTNTTTLAADADLTLAVEANSVYLVEAYLPYTSNPAGVTSGLKVGLDFPGGGSIRCNVTSSINSAMGVAGRLHTAGAEVGQNNGSAQNTHMEIRGMVQTAGTAGNVAVTWAQNNLSEDSTTVRKFAYLKFRKL